MAPLPPPSQTLKTKVTLTGAQETLLATLHSKFLDSQTPKPILGDKWAGHVLEQLDYDFRKLGVDSVLAGYLALRSRLFDGWTAEFLDAHPDATVLHLACGFDGRALRLARYLTRPAGKVRWIDVDMPDVVELRKQLLPSPDGDYALVGASVTGEAWLDTVPADRPTVVVFEGLSMYLTAAEGRSLVERVAARFPNGQLLFDCVGWLAVTLQSWIKPVYRTGSTLRWAVDDPKQLESWHEGLKLQDDVLPSKRPGYEELPLTSRMQMWVAGHLPVLRYFARDLRYEF